MKLFITDYDDTLYRNDDEINENIEKLKELQKNNFLIIISTGRSYPSIKMKVNEYQIPYDYLSCADGSIIYDNHGNIVKQFTINNEIIPVMKNFYQNLNYEEIQFSYPRGYQNLPDNTNDLLGINICFSNDNYNQKMEKEFLALEKSYLNYSFLAYAHPHYSYLCVKPKNVSKSYAISYLKEKWHIRMSDIYVIGDSSNDLEMIKDFHGVGMNNACQEILNIAKKTYNSVSEFIKDILKEDILK